MLRRRNGRPGQAGAGREGSPDAAAVSAEQAEARLIERVAGGDLAAFDLLYRSYHPRLARFLDRMTRRATLVDELLNDTMVVVWHHAGRYNGSCKVSTWIFAIAYRKALKALQRLDEPMADDDGPPEVATGEPGPEQQARRGELLAALGRSLGSLSAEHRAVVELAYFNDLGYREIAEIVDCPVDTVKTRMFHARRRLKLLLAGQLEDWL
jgi:RNA polymerase sigma-70 factor (ECF subfamily)